MRGGGCWRRARTHFEASLRVSPFVFSSTASVAKATECLLVARSKHTHRPPSLLSLSLFLASLL